MKPTDESSAEDGSRAFSAGAKTPLVSHRSGVLRTWSRSTRVFFVCTALNLVPLFYFRFIPSNDGPSHVYNAAMLHAFWFSAGGSASRVFVWNWSLPPNLLTHSALAVLMSVLSPVLAERVLVLCYAALLPIGFRYFLRSVASRTYGLEYLSLVWVYNSHLHWGFYNFLFSLILFFFASGYWLRHRQDPSGSSMTMLAGIATLLYCSHPVGLLEFWIVCGTIAGYERLTRNRSWAAGKLLVPAVAVTGALYLHYTMTRIHPAGELIDRPTVRYAGSLLFTFSPLASYSGVQRVIAAATPILLLGLTIAVVRRRRLLESIDAFGFAAVVTAALVFIAPASIGGGTMLTARLVYVPIFLLCAWLVRREWRADFGNAAAVLGIVLAFAMILSNWPYYSRYDASMKQFAAGVDWPADTNLLFRPAGPATLLLDRSGTPFLSSAAPGYLAAERGQVLVGDYQAGESYFPLRYRSNIPRKLYSSAAGSVCPGKELETEAKGVGSLVPLEAAVLVVQPQSPEIDHCFNFPPASRVKVSGVDFLYYRLPDAENALSLLR